MRDARIPVVIDGINRQGAGNLGITLVPAAGGALPEFKAGAHVDLHLADGLVRQYSIASSPARRDAYVICVRLSRDSRGGSGHVHSNLRVGDRLNISAPRNQFELHPAARYVLVAGGIGVTPLLSMAEALEEVSAPFELHYHVASLNDVAFAARLSAGFRHGQVHIYSDEDGESPGAVIPAPLLAADEDSRLYLCGPDGFMNLMADAAVRHGWGTGRIHREAFGPVAGLTLPAAEAPGSFEVKLASSGRTFRIEAHESIADVLAGAGVNVAVSCGMGICGACLTTVVSGEVDHRDSVQTDSEKCAPSQSIALCCSRSLSPLLVVDL